MNAPGGPVGIHVEGLRSVVQALHEMGFQTEDLKEGFREVGRKAVPIYARHTPRVTGRLAGDYRASNTKNKAMLRVGRAAVPYAGPQQWGWPKRNIRPKHFVQKGDREMEPKVLQILETELNRIAIEKGFR